MADRTERDTRFAISYRGEEAEREDIKDIRGGGVVGQPVVCFKKNYFKKCPLLKLQMPHNL
jgi:hypothetical protein